MIALISMRFAMHMLMPMSGPGGGLRIPNDQS
jgi:hypothetical protein